MTLSTHALSTFYLNTYLLTLASYPYTLSTLSPLTNYLVIIPPLSLPTGSYAAAAEAVRVHGRYPPTPPCSFTRPPTYLTYPSHLPALFTHLLTLPPYLLTSSHLPIHPTHLTHSPAHLTSLTLPPTHLTRPPTRIHTHFPPPPPPPPSTPRTTFLESSTLLGLTRRARQHQETLLHQELHSLFPPETLELCFMPLYEQRDPYPIPDWERRREALSQWLEGLALSKASTTTNNATIQGMFSPSSTPSTHTTATSSATSASTSTSATVPSVGHVIFELLSCKRVADAVQVSDPPPLHATNISLDLLAINILSR